MKINISYKYYSEAHDLYFVEKLKNSLRKRNEKRYEESIERTRSFGLGPESFEEYIDRIFNQEINS